MIDEFGLDFEAEKHILYLLRNAEKDRVPVLSELVVSVTVPNEHRTSTSKYLSCLVLYWYGCYSVRVINCTSNPDRNINPNLIVLAYIPSKSTQIRAELLRIELAKVLLKLSTC